MRPEGKQWRRAAVPLAAMLVLLIGCAPRLQPPGTETVAASILHEQGAWLADDGRSLPLRHWLPSGDPQAVILALHGFNDYSNAFTDAAAWWAERGIATYAPDQRGFGASGLRGLWPGEDRLADDVHELTLLLRRRYPQRPVYWLGESMGGAVALVASARPGPKPDGQILVAPAVWGRSSMPLHYRLALWLTSYTIPWKTFTGEGLGIQASDNIEMLRALSRDPLFIKATRVDAVHGLVNLMDRAATVGSDGLPVLLMYGARDEVIPRRPVERFVAALDETAAADLQVAVYENGWHMLLRDLQAETVWQDVAAWVRNPGTALPSGAERQTLPLFPEREAK